MAQKITLTVNGRAMSVEIEGHERLIDLIRDKLGLTGTKRGCDDGSCGACVVVMNGEAVRSCLTPAMKADGATIVTIEGVSQGKKLHPIQEALMEAGAVQCGYCIPGIVMELYALLTGKPKASEDEMMAALSRHFCRCTGYEAILEGARLARKKMSLCPPCLRGG